MKSCERCISRYSVVYLVSELPVRSRGASLVYDRILIKQILVYNFIVLIRRLQKPFRNTEIHSPIYLFNLLSLNQILIKPLSTQIVF